MRCALCGRELVVGLSERDDDALIGEECHIVSGRPGGPRHDSTFPLSRLDHFDNLILLCRNHHKIVDDQVKKYAVEELRKAKASHERRVRSALSEETASSGRFPTAPRLISGKDITDVIGGSLLFDFDHDGVQSEKEADLVGGFLQEAQDCGDIWSDIESRGHVDAAYEMGLRLAELHEAGFWVFGRQQVRRVKFGDGPASDYPVAFLRVLKSTSPEIVRIDVRTAQQVAGSE